MPLYMGQDFEFGGSAGVWYIVSHKGDRFPKNTFPSCSENPSQTLITWHYKTQRLAKYAPY